MKYVLLVFGLLLAIGGCFVLAVSYGTMLDGNTGSLIGTIGVSGGILVVGQVLILRSIEALKASFDRGLAARLAPYPASEAQRPAEIYDPYDHSAIAPVPVAPAFPDMRHETPPAQVDFANEDQALAVPHTMEHAIAAPKFEAVAEHAHQADDFAPEATPREAAAPDIPNIDTDLLFEAALASSPSEEKPVKETVAVPAGRPGLDVSSSDLAGDAPKTSPSLTDMWRRVTAKTAKPPGEAEELAPPPPIPVPAMPVVAPTMAAEDDVGDHEAADFHAAEQPQEEQREEEPEAFQHEAAPATQHDEVSGSPEPSYVAPGRQEPAHVTSNQPTLSHAAPEPHQSGVHDAELGDWFDRALAGLDDHSSPSSSAAPAASQSLAEPHIVPLPQNPATPTALQAPEAPSVAGPEGNTHPREMGRYEADGTIYVMYSDGSIEAQSDQGVYRFGSMAELKAFFDQQPVT